MILIIAPISHFWAMVVHNLGEVMLFTEIGCFMKIWQKSFGIFNLFGIFLWKLSVLPFFLDVN